MRTFILRTNEIRQSCQDFIGRLSTEAPYFQVAVTYYDPDKTHEQRKKWHSMLTEIGNQLGFTMGQVKHAVKVEFYGLEDFEIDGKVYTSVQSSEESKRGEYARLIDYTAQWAAEHGIQIS